MKDQFRLHQKCRVAEIPVFVLCGNDKLAFEVVEFYYQRAVENGCSKEFLADLREKIDIDFKLFREQEPEKIKLPD